MSVIKAQRLESQEILEFRVLKSPVIQLLNTYA